MKRNDSRNLIASKDTFDNEQKSHLYILSAPYKGKGRKVISTGYVRDGYRKNIAQHQRKK